MQPIGGRKSNYNSIQAYRLSVPFLNTLYSLPRMASASPLGLHPDSIGEGSWTVWSKAERAPVSLAGVGQPWPEFFL